MKTPPLLLAAALLLWGWQTGFWFVAILLAALLEGSRLVRARWDFSQADFNRIWNLCGLLFAGAAIYVFASTDGAGAMAGLFDTPARRNEALAIPDYDRPPHPLVLDEPGSGLGGATTIFGRNRRTLQRLSGDS